MKRTGRTARRVPRAAARTASLLGMLAVSALAAGTASASGGQAPPAPTAAVSLTYGCRFPSGWHRVTVGVTASLPRAAKTGKPIQPTGARLTMALPPVAATALSSLHSAAMSVATRLTVSASEGPSGTSVVWPGTARHPVDRPAHGGLTLTTTGAVPSVTASSPGRVVLTAAGLSVTFSAARATVTPGASPGPVSGGPNSAAGAAPPASGPAIQVTCTLTPGQHPALAAISATGRSKRAVQRSAASPCPPEPKGGLKLNPKFPPPKVPKGATVSFPPPSPACAYIVGYSDVRKLNGAALIGPGLTDLSLNVRTVVKNTNPTYDEFDNAGILDFKPCPTCKVVHALPPAHATFLGFGFIPVSATMQLTEVGTTNIFAIGDNRSLKTNQIFSEVTLRVYGVKVNGVPLDVGPHCQSAHPIVLRLIGNPNSNPPYSIQGGGPLTGEITIPPFHGCGASENLDPLFTASISGPGNFVLLTQGVPCFIVGSFGCPPKIPTPIRKVTG